MSLAIVIPYDKNQQISVIRRTSSTKFLKDTTGFPTFILGIKNTWRSDGFEAPSWLHEEVAKKLSPQMRKIKSFKHNITNHRIKSTRH